MLPHMHDLKAMLREAEEGRGSSERGKKQNMKRGRRTEENN